MTHMPILSSREERRAAGKRLREHVSRESHGQWQPTPQRDPLAVLRASDAGRLPSLIPLRYERMRDNAFAYLRGAAAVMAADLEGVPVPGIPVQACGDCHVGNFGVYRSPEGQTLFDINDFDETLWNVDFTVDVKRLAASVALAALPRGVEKARKAAKASACAYREHMRDLSNLSPLAIWHSRIDIDREVGRFGDGDLCRRLLAEASMENADGLSRGDTPKLASEPDRQNPADWRIADKDRTIFHEGPDGLTEAVQDAEAALQAYPDALSADRWTLVSRYARRDVAFKVVGIGSVGLVCAVGIYADADGAPLFLQIKEARPSVIGQLALKPFSIVSEGQRVIDGQRIMQAASDLFLGTAQSEASGRSYYVRQLKNRKLSAVGEILSESGAKAYAQLCGTTLARAHARSGDAVMIAGYLGKGSAFDEAIADFAMAYARQSVEDHALLITDFLTTPTPQAA
ncbi:DUF2252 domain-containing protein [Methylobacterium sp. Leaf117]|uniref:DUF2252 domain-containing protein n=1 Tax=Methylobacterium sp. Leaf117 TaxID=1736260 RepID=UPI0006FCCA4E|nr:DUF2252 domain-containing protein [Methylobacterium sp. Leaf117]KQP96707.1 hypothetical protein ASF57_02980 [Methylobacterium sp. Leaf117]